MGNHCYYVHKVRGSSEQSLLGSMACWPIHHNTPYIATSFKSWSWLTTLHSSSLTHFVCRSCKLAGYQYKFTFSHMSHTMYKQNPLCAHFKQIVWTLWLGALTLCLHSFTWAHPDIPFHHPCTYSHIHIHVHTCTHTCTHTYTYALMLYMHMHTVNAHMYTHTLTWLLKLTACPMPKVATVPPNFFVMLDYIKHIPKHTNTWICYQ